MTHPPSSTAAQPPPAWLRWGVLLAFPVLCTVVAAVFLPRPVSIDRARASVDRSDFSNHVSTSAPSPRLALDAAFGDVFTVVGADLPEKPVHPGDAITLATYLKVLTETDRDWQMFMHIDLKDGRFRIHGDHHVLDNAYPTSMWQRGEFVTDNFKKRIDSDAPVGTYEVFIGFYIGEERLPFSGGDKATHDGDNRIKLGELTLE